MGGYLDKVRRLKEQIPSKPDVGDGPDITTVGVEYEINEIDEIRVHHSAKGPLEISAWPPPDAGDLAGRWETLGRPEIPLSPGVSISELERWLSPAYNLPTWQPEHIGQVRRFLLEYLPQGEAPDVDPVLEEWRRTSIPVWQKRLQEAITDGCTSDEEYALWMLTDVLLDPEHQRPAQ